MTKTIVTILAALLYLAAGAGLAFWLGPQMLTSGRPELILLAWLLAPCWMVGGLLAYIVWADSAWSEEWQGLPEPAGPAPGAPPDARALITAT